MSKKPRVVYWNNIPSPYMVDRFNAIADRGQLDFEAWFNDVREPDRSWRVDESTWRFRYRYLPTVRLGGFRLRIPTPLFSRERPDVITSLYAEPVFVTGWLVCMLRRIRQMFWVEVTFDRWVKRRWWKNMLRRWMFQTVPGILTVSADGESFAKRSGASDRQIHFAPHVIDAEFFRRGAEAARPRRDETRREMGLQGTTFVYVGRLWYGKGLEYLLTAFIRLQQESRDEVSLLLVGDGPEESRIRELVTNLRVRNVVFAGFRHQEELPALYVASDVFVFPTLGDPYGLVLDEAMACGLPLLSSRAAGEIHLRVKERVNGYLVEPESVDGLYETMRILAGDAELRRVMGMKSAEIVTGRTPERWARDFEAAVSNLLVPPPATR